MCCAQYSLQPHHLSKHGNPAILQDEYGHEAGTVVEVDFYNATSLLGLTDEQLIQRTLHVYLAACHPAFGLCQVQDSSVLRYTLNAMPVFFSKGNSGMALRRASKLKHILLSGYEHQFKLSLLIIDPCVYTLHVSACLYQSWLVMSAVPAASRHCHYRR